MRLARLELRAYGHFGGFTLDFGDGGALHLVYGDNEAGKSRVVLDPEDVARLHTIADRLGAAADVLTPNNPIGWRTRLPAPRPHYAAV